MIEGAVGVLSGFITFTVLAALALPHLETSLTFLPIIVISVLVGFVAEKAYAKIKKSD